MAGTIATDSPLPGPRRSRRALGVGWLAILIAGSVGALGGIGVFTFGYAKGSSYLVNDPEACANCHVMQDHLDSWRKSSHHAVATCNDCHLPADTFGHWRVKADNGLFHSLAFTFENYHEPIRIKARNREVTQSACVHCHRETVDQMMPAEPDAEAPLCIQCHNDIGHAGRRRGSTGKNPRE